ncbi:MAG: alpha-galactosidase [Tannerella sp.]|nr:alpha-galactosidase [Tannerella sp.]
MKVLRFVILLWIPAFVLLSCSESCREAGMEFGKWRVSYDAGTREVVLQKGLETVSIHASCMVDGKMVSTKDYSRVRFVAAEDVRDGFGNGRVWRIVYGEAGLPALTQCFYVYEGKDYLLTGFSIEGESVSSNYMAPVNVDDFALFPASDANRALFVPFDNDCWIRYGSHRLDFEELTSYEVTAVFENGSRRGFVTGSVTHDSWKTAVKMTGNGAGALKSLVCYGGAADTLTRDSKPHGMLSGKVITSPRVLVGVFDDWRDGLEAYGSANAVIAPPKAWNGAAPFGWNSWGVLQFNLTFPKAMEVSDYIRENLQENRFVNADGVVYVGLDSGWNRFTEEELAAFVRKCRANGQVAGIYWTPFTDWGKNPEAAVRDAEGYTYKDIYVYANGKPQALDGAYAVDPTHPAVEERMKKTSDLFRRCGFEYVKMDFMTHGAMEGDRWHRPEIRTGIQAYNYGMQLLNAYFGDMYINLSISPVFPAQYAQSRRIACDAWNKIKDTEYTMNAVSYGWWIDRVYQYNDADHIVLRDATEGENRARITSSVITGLYITGEDYSLEGGEEGKARSQKYLTNAAINALANGITFRPLEGDGARSEHQFVRNGEDGICYICFNYGEEEMQLHVPLDRMGLNPDASYPARELWRNEPVDLKKAVTVPAKDVVVVFINK